MVTTRSEARTRLSARPPTSRYRPEPPRPQYSPPEIECEMSRSRYTTPQNRTTSLLPRFAEVESGAFTHRMTDSTRSATTSSILITRSTSLFSRPPRSTGPGPSDIVHHRQLRARPVLDVSGAGSGDLMQLGRRRPARSAMHRIGKVLENIRLYTPPTHTRHQKQAHGQAMPIRHRRAPREHRVVTAAGCICLRRCQLHIHAFTCTRASA